VLFPPFLAQTLFSFEAMVSFLNMGSFTYSILSKVILSVMFLLLAHARSSEASSIQEDYLIIKNTPQCAAEMKLPADSIFIALSLRNSGIVLNNLAKKAGKDPSKFLTMGMNFYKWKLNQLTELILEGLNSEQLPLVSSKEEAAQSLKSRFNLISGSDYQENKKFFKKVSCFRVNEINSVYSHLFLRGLNKEALTQLAKLFSEKKSSVSCLQQEPDLTNPLDLYPVFNYDLDLINKDKWNKEDGYRFWSSFKIYLSVAWRENLITSISKSPLNQFTLLNPMEEQVLMLSNGCKSIEPPQCNSDFLSASELRMLFTTNRKKLELTGSSVEMRDYILDNHDKTDTHIKQAIAQKSNDQSWIRDFQRYYMGFSSELLKNLFHTNKLFSTALKKYTLKQLRNDLIFEVRDPKNLEEAHYLCVEHRLLMQEEPFSVYKMDLDNLKQNGFRLDPLIRYGMSVSEIVLTYQKISAQVTEACNELDSRQVKEADAKWSNFRPWYRNFMSRYKLIQDAIESEDKDGQVLKIDKFIPKAKTYLPDLCTDSIDCHRNFIESIVKINRLLIASNTFLRNDVTSLPLFNERGEKIACKIYDPFEVSRLNKKKLVTDFASSVIFGLTPLPIYLDINFKPKELMSFSKMIEKGYIKFSAEYDKNKMTQTLAMHLGSFFNIPCAINISEVGADVGFGNNSNFVFKGLSAGACKGKKTESMTSPTGEIDVFKKSPESGLQVCGKCSFDFEQVSYALDSNVFFPLRTIIRFIQSLVRYNEVKNNDYVNPREYVVSIPYLLETYEQNGHVIPESCVGLLSRGLPCYSNACEAIAVREFELKTKLKVDSIWLDRGDEAGGDSYQSAWIRVKGCSHELRLNFRCSDEGETFWMPVMEREYRKCKGSS
jgi:hypothetical protein